MWPLLGLSCIRRVEVLWVNFWKPVAQSKSFKVKETAASIKRELEEEINKHCGGEDTNGDLGDLVDEEVDEEEEEMMDEEEEEEEEEEEAAEDLHPQQAVRRKMSQLMQMAEVRQFVLDADYAFYQKLANFLMPKVLKSIPNNLTQAIRNFAKSLDGWMASAVSRAPADVAEIKIKTVKCLSQALRRYTGLNHLAQAARAVLQNNNQIAQVKCYN